MLLVNPCYQEPGVLLVIPCDEGVGVFHQLIPVMRELVCFTG